MRLNVLISRKRPYFKQTSGGMHSEEDGQRPAGHRNRCPRTSPIKQGLILINGERGATQRIKNPQTGVAY